MRRELILGEDMAQKQLDLFFDWYDFDFEEMLVEAQKRGEEASLLIVKKSLIKAVRQGRLEIREEKEGDGTTLIFEQSLDHKVNGLDKIKYHEVTAGTHISMRPGKNVSDEARLFDFLAILSKTEVATLAKLKGADTKLAQLIGYLFLAV